MFIFVSIVLGFRGILCVVIYGNRGCSQWVLWVKEPSTIFLNPRLCSSAVSSQSDTRFIFICRRLADVVFPPRLLASAVAAVRIYSFVTASRTHPSRKSPETTFFPCCVFLSSCSIASVPQQQRYIVRQVLLYFSFFLSAQSIEFSLPHPR
jgi:hypothetical protein